MLVDWQIDEAVLHGNLRITPYDSKHLQPASYDVCLGGQVRKTGVFADWEEPIDTAGRVDGYMDLVEIPDDGLVIGNGQFLLGHTVEKLRLPVNMLARVEGKSSLGRLGIMIHSTAGFIDPGFEGQITLEISNLNARPVRLHAGMPIAQVCFYPCDTPANDYSRTGRYQHQTGPQESRYSLPG